MSVGRRKGFRIHEMSYTHCQRFQKKMSGSVAWKGNDFPKFSPFLERNSSKRDGITNRTIGDRIFSDWGSGRFRLPEVFLLLVF